MGRALFCPLTLPAICRYTCPTVLREKQEKTSRVTAKRARKAAHLGKRVELVFKSFSPSFSFSNLIDDSAHL